MNGKIRFAYTIKIATPDNEAAINNVLEASFSSLLSSKYDDISLEPILPKVTRINPQLLSSGTYYIALNKTATKVIKIILKNLLMESPFFCTR